MPKEKRDAFLRYTQAEAELGRCPVLHLPLSTLPEAQSESVTISQHIGSLA